MPNGLGKFRGGSGVGFGSAQYDYHRLPGIKQVTADTRVDQQAGTRFFDVISNYLKKAYVTADLESGAVAEYTNTETATVRTPETGEYNVAEKRGDYFRTSGNDTISWEVGRKKQIVYTSGIRYDISIAIGSDKTIRAAFKISDIAFTVLTVDTDGVFAVYDVDVSDPDAPTATMNETNISQTVNKGRDDTDIKQLYSSFINGTQLVSIEITNTVSKIGLFQRQEGGSWAFSLEIASFETIQAVSTQTIHRTNPAVGTALPSNGNLTVTVAASNISSGNRVTDYTTLTGKRIVAARAGTNAIAILVENVDTTCHHDVDKPPYASGYFMWQTMHPIFALGFPVAKAYDWRISTTAYDSGKMIDKWTRHSAPTYTRYLFEIEVDSQNRTVVKSTNGTPFSGGTLDSMTSFYYRFANASYQASNVNQPIPPDIAGMVTFLRGKEYSENSYNYTRTWNNCIRFYAADPLSDTYLYFKANGTLDLGYLSYLTPHVIHPDPADLEPHPGINATISLVVRQGDQEHQYLVRDMDLQAGVSIPNRTDMHFEPHMVYYTQPQPNAIGELRNYSSAENVSINKSINICFSGRYVATDEDKTGFAVNLKADFDVPDFDYPTISTDGRYTYFSEGTIVFQTGSALVQRTFFESWRPHFHKDGTPIADGDPPPTFDPDAPLDLEYRNFEDRHRRADNVNDGSKGSNDVELITENIPPEWPDIRGWIDFRRRGGFTTWEEASINPFVTSTYTPAKDGQPALTTYNFVLSGSVNAPPITVMEDF